MIRRKRGNKKQFCNNGGTLLGSSSTLDVNAPLVNKPTSVLFRSPRGQGFPDRYRCTLRTANFLTLAGGAASAIRTVCWRANNAYAVGPNVDAGGYNANYPTEMAQLFSSASVAGANVYAPPYSQYRIFGSKIQIAITGSGAAGTNTHVVLWPSADSVAGLFAIAQPTYAQASEFPYAKAMVIPGYSTSARVATISNGCATDRMFGVPSALIYANEYASEGVAGPTYQWYHNLICQPENGQTVTVSLSWTVEYDIEFFARTMPYTAAP